MQFLTPGLNDFATGIVFGGDQYEDVEILCLRPILLTFRPLSARGAAIDLGHCRAVAGTVPVGTVPCAIIDHSASKSIRKRYFVDLANECAIRRYESHIDGTLRTHFEVDYDRVNDTVVPVSWKWEFLSDDGQALEAGAAMRTKVVFHSDMSDATFRLVFPVGTLVDDRRAMQKYIVLPGDRRHLVTPSQERQVSSYRELIDRVTTGSHSFGRYGVIALVMVATCMLIAAGWFYSKHYRLWPS